MTGTTPEGQATSNATLEGPTISRSGRGIVAAMEGALSGDVSSSGDATLHRFLVYDLDRHGNWQLTKQIAYRTEAGNRIPEVQAYGRDTLLVPVHPGPEPPGQAAVADGECRMHHASLRHRPYHVVKRGCRVMSLQRPQPLQRP